MVLRLNPITGELDLVGADGGAGTTTDLTGDVGGAVSPDGADSITLIGDSTQAYLQTTGTPASNQMEIKLLEPAADGELLIGNTATGEPSVGTLTAGTGINITNGNGAITVTSTATSALAAPTDSGTANSVAGSMDFFGGNGVSTSASGNTVTIEADADVPTTFTTDSGSAVPAGNSLSIAGGIGIDTSGAGAGVTVTNVTAPGWNGSIIQTASVSAASDGGTITFSVERSGGGDLTVIFSSGEYAWDTTPADTVTLAAGSDTSPTLNYVYLLESDLNLTASTVGWPAAEHAPLATVLCQSAATFQTKGAYKFHAWTDHIVRTTDQGHVGDINFWIRQQDATYVSGVDQTYTITTNGGSADNVILTTASGVVLQLHNQAFPAFGGTPDLYVVNDSVTPYTIVTDLNALLTDSTGASMSGRYFSLVIWGVVSEDTGDCKLMVNLPGGSYNNQTGVEQDQSRFSNYTIPKDFTGTGFLISEWKVRHQATASGTWTSIEKIDLRGLIPALQAGGSATGAVEFPDNTFRIFDDADSTAKIAFVADAVSTATVRSITMPDQDIDLTPTTGDFQGSDATLTALAAYNTNGILTQTAADTFVGRTITATAPIAVANGDGVAGNPVISITDPLPVVNGGSLRASATAYSVICGGTTATGAHQSVADVGNAGEVLTSNGAGILPSWQPAGGGSGITYLSTATASASSSLDFDSLIDSTYNLYMFVFDNISYVGGTTTSFSIRTSTDGGSSYDSTNGDYYWANTAGTHSELTSQMRVIYEPKSGYTCTGIVYMFNPSDATIPTSFTWKSTHAISDGAGFDWASQSGGGRRVASEAVDAVRFVFSANTILAGTIKMYGMTTPL